MNSPHISVITPVYGCAASLPKLYERLKSTLEQISSDFEIIMVNDASPDNAWECIQELAKADERVKGINFSRNFGQHRAIAAGLDYAEGEWVVVMDCDLQDQPEEIFKLYAKAMEGFDVVFGRRIIRNDTFFKRISSQLFYRVYNYFTDSGLDGSIANFSIISKKVVLYLRRFNERNRPYALMVNWLGFKREDIEIVHSLREVGKSSYTVRKLIDLAIDIIVAHSNKPLKISIRFGFLMSLLSVLYACWLIFRYYAYGVSVEGWTSVIVSIFFVSGLLFANLGIIGLYIGSIYDETKRRPFYVISDMTPSAKKRHQ